MNITNQLIGRKEIESDDFNKVTLTSFEMMLGYNPDEAYR